MNHSMLVKYFKECCPIKLAKHEFQNTRKVAYLDSNNQVFLNFKVRKQIYIVLRGVF